MATCTAKTKSGSPCTAPAQRGRAFCFRHDPEKAEAQQLASEAGGVARSTKRPPPHDLRTLPELKDAASACAILSSTVHWVLQDKLDPRAATAIATCIRTFGELRRDEELEEKLRELEAAVNGAPPPPAVNGHAVS